MNTPAPGSSEARAFSEEKPLYVFYAHPRDASQEVTAQVLCVYSFLHAYTQLTSSLFSCCDRQARSKLALQ